jgi:cytochrome c peroxidase
MERGLHAIPLAHHVPVFFWGHLSKETSMRDIFSQFIVLSKLARLVTIAGVAGVMVMLLPMHAADADPPDPGDVRSFAAGKGLKSLRVAIQEDSDSNRGSPLLLGPEGRNVPLPRNLNAFLNPRNNDARRVAAQLGKALFWDMAVGSDGNACASCHFHAGGDRRVKNQLSPDLTRFENVRDGDIKGFHFANPDPDTIFDEPAPLDGAWGPNYTLLQEDFPFVKFIGNGDNVDENGDTIDPAEGNTNDVASSMGVFFTEFHAVDPDNSADTGVENVFNRFALGSSEVEIRDKGVPHPDPLGFQVDAPGGAYDGKTNVRRVEPRNTPTNINAVFNFHNFWDGRANHWFNGVTPFGRTDREARIFSRGRNGKVASRRINMANASLASQAVGPPLSAMEMSFFGRIWPDVGKKMVGRYLLESQTVHPDDSLLGELLEAGVSPVSGKGINVSYGELIQQAFNPELWDSDGTFAFDASSLKMLNVNSPLLRLGEAQLENSSSASYTLMEANFSFFFGVALMLYQAELVADDTPFDRFMAGDDEALTPGELVGLAVYVGFPGFKDGRCVNCHGGPELTNASVRNAQEGNNIIEPMLMGNAAPAFYDNGFYNISVTPTAEDRGRGDQGPEAKPLSSSRQFLFHHKGIQNINFPIIGAPVLGLVCENSCVGDGSDVLGFVDEATSVFFPVCTDVDADGACSVDDEIILQRVAVDGAFKTPGIRNQELMGPYFHNGGAKTLLEVVEFYDRGGNFCRLNFADLDPDIQSIGLSPAEEEGLVKLMIAMTDERVRNRMAPFDHPELRIPDGHPGDQDQTVADGDFANQQAIDVVQTIAAVGAGGGAPLEAFHAELGIPDGFVGHMVAGSVCSEADSSEGCDDPPRCNRPPPE